MFSPGVGWNRLLVYNWIIHRERKERKYKYEIQFQC